MWKKKLVVVLEKLANSKLLNKAEQCIVGAINGLYEEPVVAAQETVSKPVIIV